MLSPLEVQGCFELGSSSLRDVEKVLRELEEAIRRENPRFIKRYDMRIIFKGRLFRVGNLNQLWTGQIWINLADSTMHVHYKFSVIGLLILSILTVVAFGLILLPAGLSREGVAFLGIIWILSFGLNYVRSRLRYSDFLRKTAARALESAK